MKITFLPQNRTGEAEAGETILEAARKFGLHIESPCGGLGTCGKCKVKVTYKNGDIVYTPACRQTVSEGMVIEIPTTEERKPVKEQFIFLPKDFKVQGSKEAGYGAAVDLGTTTVCLSLWDLQTGESLGTTSFANPQRAYGADVISRITFAAKGQESLKLLQRLMVKAINRAVLSLLDRKGLPAKQLRRYVAVGNTTMSHLFLGLNPSSLAAAPFVPAFTGSVDISAEALGLTGGKNCAVHVAPNLGGHVGSDITAGLLAAKVMDGEDGHLFIDIGTNGEIVLSGKGKILCCSAAAGPAFEGGSISQGMRAETGAVEGVSIDPAGVSLSVIGGGVPKGICGSGIIDAVSQLLQMGIADRTGRILGREELSQKGLSENLLRHIKTNGMTNDFVLYFSEDGRRDVVLTQQDMREVQLAKGAIFAGIGILMGDLGLTEADLRKVSVAGAFGSYIRVPAAMTIGLLPKVSEKRVVSLGNAAGMGAAMILLSEEWRQKAEETAERVAHVEMAARSDFQEAFMTALNF